MARAAHTAGSWGTRARIGQAMPRRSLLAMRRSNRMERFAAVLRGDCCSRLARLLLIVSFAAITDHAVAQTCPGDCNGDGTVQINELILGVNIALDALAISECPSLDNGQGTVTVDRLILAVNDALSGCGVSPTPTATPTSGESVSMWTVDNYEVQSSDCAGVIEDAVVRALESRGPDFTVRQSDGSVEIEDNAGNVLDGTADPDGTVHVQERFSNSIVTCDYDVHVDASVNLSDSPATATYDGAVNFSGFCLGFSDCSMQITSRWRRVDGAASSS